MRITITQLNSENDQALQASWSALCEHAQQHNSDFVLLPEMPFFRWLPATPDFDADAWGQAVTIHESWLVRFSELGVPFVGGTLPRIGDNKRYNTGFIWRADDGDNAHIELVHDKMYLPNEEGVWEREWYDAGAPTYDMMALEDINIGYTICSEIWVTELARRYGKSGAHLLLAPRATEGATQEKWLTAGRMNAMVAGAYHFSSNRFGTTSTGSSFGGGGWAIAPDGRVLAQTNDHTPYITLDIDWQIADNAKDQYPCYL
jgi:N-carbamoylputrescine amidase